MWPVTFHYWAGARAVAGVEFETVQAASVADAIRVIEARRGDARYAAVMRASSALVDGLTLKPGVREALLTGPVQVEILPPFAGG